MFELSSMWSGLELLFDIEIWFTVVIGIFIGLIFGALPGITTSLCLTLFFPIALSLSASTGVILLLAIYSSTIVGAGVVAVLFNIPGNPGSIATTFDGYPLTCMGKGCFTLGVHIFSSTFGGVFSWLMLLLFFVPLSSFASLLGSIDVFLITVLVVVLVGVMGERNLIRSLFSAALGLFIAINNTPYNQSNPVEFFHLTFGDTLPLVIILVGLFSAPELFKLSKRKTICLHESTKEIPSYKSLLGSLKSLSKNKLIVLQSSIIGLVVGLLPAAGAALSSMTAYFVAKKTSSKKGKFGKGEVAGVIAPECANNASVGGSMLVLLLLGIPGSNSSAVIYGFLVEKGIPVGNQLFTTHPNFVFSVVFGGLFCALLLGGFAFIIAPHIANVVKINSRILLPLLLCLVCFSAYFYRGLTGDIIILCLFSTVGILMNRYGYPIISMVLGMFLGKSFINGLNDSYQLVMNENASILDKPFALILFILIVFLLGKHATAVFTKQSD